MDDLKNHLLTYLNASREAVLWKAEGLGDYDLTRPLVPSGTNILGLIQHLACVELGYFVECLGQTVEHPRFIALNESDDPEYDMWVPADVPSADILDFYRSAIDSANRNIAALPLDAPATVPWWAAGETEHHHRPAAHPHERGDRPPCRAHRHRARTH